MRRGFTLVEVVVALLVVEVGLLGVVGLLVSAQRTLAEAVRREIGVTEVGRVLDSLAAAPGEGAGFRDTAAGTLRWWVGPAGVVRLELAGGTEGPWLVVETRLGPAGGP